MTSKFCAALFAVAFFFFPAFLHAENFRVMAVRGTVRVYFPNGQKERGARGQILETDQRWVVEKKSGLYLEGDKGSKISFINSGVLFFRKKADQSRGWQLEVSGRELYVYLAENSDLSIEAPKAHTAESPVEFYYEDLGPKTIVRVLQGEVQLLDGEDSVPMKTLIIEDDDVEIEPFDRADFNRVQTRHENNSLGRDPDRSPLKERSAYLPWRLSLQGQAFWSHLLPANDSTFAQDRLGFAGQGQLTKDILLRRPPSPISIPWMPRLRGGFYGKIFRPKWRLSSAGEYQPLAKEFGFAGGLAWDGFFLMGTLGYLDFSSPFRATHPLTYGLQVGIESVLKETDVYRIFWSFGLNFHHAYVEVDVGELGPKGISHGRFRSLSYGFLTGPSVAF